MRGVVLVVLDAARARSVGAFGGPAGVTPHLDALARESLVFPEAFTPAVFTRAAMAALWTSREPGERGARKAPRLAEALRTRGVRTAAFVANPNAGRSFGHDRGFEEFLELDDVPPPGSERLLEPFDRFLARVKAPDSPPFFAYLHLREPHFPYDPPPPFAARFRPLTVLPEDAVRDADWFASLNRRGGLTSAEALDLERAYEANLAYADHLVGRLRESLRAAGLAGRVALVVTADHGESLGEHGHLGHNEQVYEESARVPLILHLPGGPAARVPRLASLLDVAPTVSRLLRVATPSFRGVSLLDRVGPRDRRLVCRSAHPEGPVAVRGDRYALLTTGHRAELFDRRQDPDERVDLAAREPALLASLQVEWAPGPGPTDPADEAPRLEAASREALRALGYLQ